MTQLELLPVAPTCVEYPAPNGGGYSHRVAWLGVALWNLKRWVALRRACG